MERKFTLFSFAAGLGCALMLGGALPASAAAQGDTTDAAQAGSTDPAQPSGTTLSLEDVIAHLKAQGYGPFFEVEREGTAYEVKARNPQGQTLELHLDAQTAALLGREAEG